jgi:hypothetical protein
MFLRNIAIHLTVCVLFVWAQESLADKAVSPDKKLASLRTRQQSFDLENDFTCDDVVDV